MERYCQETNQDLPVSVRLFETSPIIGATTPALSETNDTSTNCPSSPKSFPIDRSDRETYRIPADEFGRGELEQRTYRIGHQLPAKRHYLPEIQQLFRGTPSSSKRLLAPYPIADITFEEHGRVAHRQLGNMYGQNQPGSQRTTHPQSSQAAQQGRVTAIAVADSEANTYSPYYGSYSQGPVTQGSDSYDGYYTSFTQGQHNLPAVSDGVAIRSQEATAGAGTKRKSEDRSEVTSSKRLPYAQPSPYTPLPQAPQGQRPNNVPVEPAWYRSPGAAGEQIVVDRNDPYGYSGFMDNSRSSAASAFSPPVASQLPQVGLPYSSSDPARPLQTNTASADDSRPHACTDCEKSFRQKADLSRHRVSVHRDDGQRYFCPTEECATSSKRFSRRDNLLDHLKRVHKLPTDDKDQVTRLLNAGKVSEARQ